MASLRSSISRYLLPTSSLFGVLGLAGGIYSFFNPVAFSSTLGIPVASASSPALPFVSFAAARNLGSGITLLSLCAGGHRKAIGIFSMAGVSTAWADAWVCATNGAEEGKAVAHAITGLVFGALGAALFLDLMEARTIGRKELDTKHSLFILLKFLLNLLSVISQRWWEIKVGD